MPEARIGDHHKLAARYVDTNSAREFQAQGYTGLEEWLDNTTIYRNRKAGAA